MTDSNQRGASASDLATEIARSTAVAWTVGVLVLTVLAVGVASRSLSAETDALLEAHALAAYGLAWFDSDAELHTELLEREVGLVDPSVAIAFATSDAIVWGDAPDGAREVAALAMSTEMETWQNLGSIRVLSIPTYDDDDRLAGAVITSSSRGPARAATLRFALATGLGSLLLIALGLAASKRLSQRVLASTMEGIVERERILAGAAHEVQTPLAAILAVAESTPAEDAVRALEQIRETSVTAAEMVRRLLAWSQLADRRLEREPVRLDLLVETCLDPTDIFDAEPTIIDGDPRMLGVAVRNLIENARVHGGGLRAVTLRGRRLVVEDELGLPIDAPLLSPFVKGRESSGSGIGLALVARIVDLHGACLDLGPPRSVTWPAEKS